MAYNIVASPQLSLRFTVFLVSGVRLSLRQRNTAGRSAAARTEVRLPAYRNPTSLASSTESNSIIDYQLVHSTLFTLTRSFRLRYGEGPLIERVQRSPDKWQPCESLRLLSEAPHWITSPKLENLVDQGQLV